MINPLYRKTGKNQLPKELWFGDHLNESHFGISYEQFAELYQNEYLNPSYKLVNKSYWNYLP
jgi:hypothetical protein